MAKIITVYSIVQGNGAKFIATNLADAYKKSSPSSNVALVDFDFRYPFLANTLAPKDDIHGIDNLIEKIDGDFLDAKLFKENMVHLKNGVDLLKGTKLQNKHSLIDRNHIEKVIQCLRESYDVAIIVANSDFDNSGSVYSAINADSIILIGQPNYPTYLNIESVSKKIDHYAQMRCKKWFLYNKYYESRYVDLKPSVSQCGLSVLGVVPQIDNAVDNMDLKDSTLKNLLGGNRTNKTEKSLFDEMIQKL